MKHRPHLRLHERNIMGENVMRGKGTICIKGVVILLTVLVLQGTNWAWAEELTVMTRNLYCGPTSRR